MYQEGRVLRTLEGSGFWLTGEVRPLGNVNHAGGCGVCALLCLAGGRSWEDGSVERSQAGNLQTKQVTATRCWICRAFFKNWLHCLSRIQLNHLLEDVHRNWSAEVFSFSLRTSFYSSSFFFCFRCTQCSPLFPVSPVPLPPPSENRFFFFQTADWREDRVGDLNPHIYLCIVGECCVLLPRKCCRSVNDRFSLPAAVVVNFIFRWLFRLIAALSMHPLD